MPRVSKYKLDKDLLEELLNQFWYSIGNINNRLKTSEFFNDFLTETEKVMLAKRFASAILLKRGKFPKEIRDAIGVSYSTILSVSSWLRNSKPSTERLVSKIAREKRWESMLDKIDEVLDKLPPRRRSDWKEEYKKKQDRTNKRLARKHLR